MSFTEHLGELRTRIMRAAMAVGVGFIVCFIFSESILNVIAAPLRFSEEAVTPAGPEGAGGAPDAMEGGNTMAVAPQAGSRKGQADFVSLGPLEPFFVRMKVAMYAAIVLAFPYVLYQLCAFIFPGLKPSERNVAQVLIVGCGLLASLGVMVAYFGVFPFILPYMLLYNPDWVTTQLRLDETIMLIVKGLLGFSVAFQFPMAVLVLVYLGVLHPSSLKQYRKIVLVGLAFLSALFTPPDPLSMLLMLVPLYLLYELSILCSYVVLWRANRPVAPGEE
jgi:sec-independent protein translocase protein TatC